MYKVFYEEDVINSNDPAPENIHDFILWLKEKIALVPKDVQDSVIIEIDPYVSCSSANAVIRLKYWENN